MISGYMFLLLKVLRKGRFYYGLLQGVNGYIVIILLIQSKTNYAS